jgi:hypothetical protein
VPTASAICGVEPEHSRIKPYNNPWRNSFSFRNVVFSIFYNTGRWEKYENPVTLSVIHHRQNRLETNESQNWIRLPHTSVSSFLFWPRSPFVLEIFLLKLSIHFG